MATSGILTSITEHSNKYSKFYREKVGIYMDDNHKLSTSLMKKVNKESIMEDFQRIWRICSEMKSVLGDCAESINKTQHNIIDKNKLIENLQSEKSDQSAQLAALEKFSDMKNEILSEIKQTTQVRNRVPESPKSQPKEQIKHKLMLEKPSGEKITDQQWSTVVKSSMRKQLRNVQVSSSYLAYNGVPTMVFPSAEVRDVAAEALKSDYKVISQDQTPKKLSPKLKILGLSTDVFNETDEDIIQEIRIKNPSIDELVTEGEEIKIVYKKKEDHIVVIRTTRKIKDAVKRMNNKIYFGLQVLNVYDHVHPVQCFHCQEFGHYSGSVYCKSKDQDSTCFYCSSRDHKSAECKVKKNPSKHRCANCIKDKRSHTHHKATDPLCPAVIKETLRVYSRTDGMDGDSKNYYLQMIEKLKSKRTLV